MIIVGGNFQYRSPISPIIASPSLPKHPQARYNIPVLDTAGKDYTHWKLCAQLIFRAQGLWGVIDGSDPEPDATMDATAHTNWMARDCEAWIQIAMSVQGQCLNAILDAKSGKECWDKLAAKLKGKGEGCIAYLMEKVFHGNLSESEPMELQIEKLLATTHNLRSLGFPLNEKVVAFAIITSLPESLSMLKTVLYGTKGADLTIDSITAQIYLNETHHMHASGSSVITFNSEQLGQALFKIVKRLGIEHKVSVLSVSGFYAFNFSLQ
jgi:LTR polyprotein gag-polypeptide-like protein